MASFIRQISSKISQISRFTPIKVTNSLPTLVNICAKHYSNATTPYEIVDETADRRKAEEVIRNVNTQVKELKQGRLFAVVHVAGKQFKVTEGDVIIIEGYWPPDTGDKITLDKVMLAGAADFTLVGTPLVQKGLIRVEATVIEKSLSHTKTHFRKKRRKQYKRINFYRIPHTMLRINTVSMAAELNNPPDVRGLENVVF